MKVESKISFRSLNDNELAAIGGGMGAGSGGGNGRGGGSSGGSNNGNHSNNGSNNGNQSGNTCNGAPGGNGSGNGNGGNGGNGGSCGGGSSRVICTHFYRKGMMDQTLWRSDLEYTFKHISPRTVRGYQAWAIPYVKLMRRSQLAERIMYPIAYHRARELAFQLGHLPKGSLRGKLIRLVFEPSCFLIGQFVAEQNWEALWSTKTVK